MKKQLLKIVPRRKPKGLMIITALLISISSIQSQTITQEPDPQTFFLSADSLFMRGQYKEASEQYQVLADKFRDLNMIGYEAKALNKLAEMQWRMGRLDAAKKNANLALSVYEDSDLNDSLRIVNNAMSNNSLGVISGMGGDFQGALQAFQKVIRIGQKDEKSTRILLGIANNNIGRLYNRMGNLDSAILFYKKSLTYKDLNESKDQRSIADTYYAISLVYNDKSYYDEAISYATKAIDIQKRILEPNHPLLGHSYTSLSVPYSNLGQYSLAIDYLNESVRIFEGLEGMELPLATAYSYLADVSIIQEAYDEALIAQNKCLQIRKGLLKPNDLNFAYSYDDLAEVYLGKSELEKAEYYALASIKIKEAILFESSWSLIKTYSLLARIYNVMEDYAKASFYMDKSIDHLSRGIKGEHPSFSELYNLKGDILLENGKVRDALDSYQQAVENNFLPLNDQLPKTSSSEPSPENSLLLLHSLSSKAHAYYLLFEASKNIDELKKSYESYLLCDQLIGRMRQTHMRYEDKTNFGKITNDVYHKGVGVSLTLGQLLNDSEYTNQAFLLAEKAKTSALSDHVWDVEAKEFAGIPSELIKLEKSLKIDLSSYQSQINELTKSQNGYDTTSIDRIISQRFQAELELDSLNDYLERNHPDYVELKYKQDVIPVKDVQSRLSSREALLEYLEYDSLLYAFVITKTTFEVVTLKKDSSLERSLKSLSSIFNGYKSSNQSIGYFENEAHILYQKLLNETLSRLNPEIDKLLLIPTPELSLIPWELSITEKRASELDDPNYLINDYTVSYGYSSSLYFKETKGKSKSRHDAILAFAPSYAENSSESTVEIKEVFRDGFKPLKWNRSEAQSIEKFFDGTKIVQDDEATESMFKSDASDYRILHLAMHAFVDHEEAMQSKLVFSTSNDSIEDGALHTYELYNMDLDAELAILSACQTGFGKVEKGEGVVSLARGFAYAGVPSVVMSHWKVDDQATSLLMEKFYKYLSEGQQKSEALRNAKLEYLKEASPNKKHPFFWGAFVVIGDDSPISRQSNLGMWIALSVVFLTLFLIFLRKRNQKVE